MKKLIFSFMIAAFTFSALADSSQSVYESKHTVKATLDKLEIKLKEKGMTIFSRISHSKGASGVGLKLADTEVLIFGNPKIGTKLMNCNQKVGLDLPLKMLAWKDNTGKVWLAHTNVELLGAEYKISECAKKELGMMKAALGNFATFATH